MTVVGGVLGDGDGVFEVEVADGVSEPALSETKVVVGWVLDVCCLLFVVCCLLFLGTFFTTHLSQ